MSALAKIQTALPEINPELLTTIDRLYASIECVRGEDVLPALIGYEQRSKLQARSVELHTALRPISMASEDAKRAAECVAALLAAYLNIRNNAGETTRIYVGHLSDQPLFAIRQACSDFKNGRVFDTNSEGDRVYFTLDHAPSAFRLLDQVKKIADAYRAEHWKINRVLKIKHVKPQDRHVSPEEAELVIKGIRELSEYLSVSNTKAHAEHRARIHKEAQEARDRAARIKENAARRRAEEEAPAHP